MKQTLVIVGCLVLTAVVGIALLLWQFERPPFPLSRLDRLHGGMTTGSRNTGSASLYVQHPGSAALGGGCVIANESWTPTELRGTAAFIYSELRKLHTKADLIHAVVEKFGPSLPEGPVPIEAILQAMIEKGFVAEILPGAVLPAEGYVRSRQLLSEAEVRLRAGDWSAAEAMCEEAGRNPAFAEVAELNALIARYQGGQLAGIVERACMLSSRLNEPIAQAACDGLTLLAAHRTGDLGQAKLIALHLERRYQSALDLPTVPQFAALVRGQIIIVETGPVDPMLAVIDDLVAARVGSPDECALLEKLARRYRERAAQRAGS
jgi:hypothetical protein